MSNYTMLNQDAETFLDGLADDSVDAIITSPPYSGLPGRADTLSIVSDVIAAANRILTDNGHIVLVVGSTDQHPLLPFHVARLVELSGHASLRGLYVWDRTERLERRVLSQTVGHDYIIHATRAGYEPFVNSLCLNSIIRGHADKTFDYGSGVTLPPSLAGELVYATTEPGSLVVDPFAGLGEVGVQAVQYGRRFAGTDTDRACVAIAKRRLASTQPS